MDTDPPPVTSSEPRIPLPMEAIRAFCERWGVVELALFGSVLRDDFGPESDVDVLVTLPREHALGIFDHFAMERELSEVIGRRVEITSRRAVEDDGNWLRRREILSSARTIHVAA